MNNKNVRAIMSGGMGPLRASAAIEDLDQWFHSLRCFFVYSLLLLPMESLAIIRISVAWPFSANQSRR